MVCWSAGRCAWFCCFTERAPANGWPRARVCLVQVPSLLYLCEWVSNCLFRQLKAILLLVFSGFSNLTKERSLSSNCQECSLLRSWAARYDTGLLIKLTPKGVVFSFLFFSCFGRAHDSASVIVGGTALHMTAC